MKKPESLNIVYLNGADTINTQQSNIQSGGDRDWGEIGYREEPPAIGEYFTYAKNILENWDTNKTSVSFQEDKSIAFFPVVDTTNLKSLSFFNCVCLVYIGDTINLPKLTTAANMFNNCYNLNPPSYFYLPECQSMSGMFRYCIKIQQISIVCPKSTSLYNLFAYCSGLKRVDILTTDNVTDLSGSFYLCSELEHIPVINAKKMERLLNTFYGCSKLTSITLLELDSVINLTGTFTSCTLLSFLLITNLGKSSLTTYDFSEASAWGTGSEENRQSLIDSLITHSYDRASNGMDTSTIKLSSNTKALLTEEEIAQITQKGFTIT